MSQEDVSHKSLRVTCVQVLVVISKSCSLAMAASPPAANQQHSYEIFEKKPDMERTTGQGSARSELMHRWQHLLPHQVNMLQHLPLGHGRVE
jgi:hypothetical protein